MARWTAYYRTPDGNRYPIITVDARERGEAFHRVTHELVTGNMNAYIYFVWWRDWGYILEKCPGQGEVRAIDRG